MMMPELDARRKGVERLIQKDAKHRLKLGLQLPENERPSSSSSAPSSHHHSSHRSVITVVRTPRNHRPHPHIHSDIPDGGWRDVTLRYTGGQRLPHAHWAVRTQQVGQPIHPHARACHHIPGRTRDNKTNPRRSDALHQSAHDIPPEFSSSSANARNKVVDPSGPALRLAGRLPLVRVVTGCGKAEEKEYVQTVS